MGASVSGDGDPSTATSTDPAGSGSSDASSVTAAPTDDSTSTTTSDTTGSQDSESTGGETCNVGDVCVSIPEGWSGPIVAGSGGSCKTEYSTQEVAGFSTLSVPPSTCECDCGASDSECVGPTTLSRYQSGACNAFLQSWVLADEVLSIGNLTGDSNLLLDPLVPTSGSCPPLASEEIPPPVQLGQANFCGLPDAPPKCQSGDGVCVPDSNTRCIYREGEEACPDGYRSADVFFQSVADTRSCSACTCSSATGSCPDALVEFRNQSDQLLYTLPSATCTPMPVGEACGVNGDLICTEDYVELVPGSASTSCSPSASILSGTATPMNPVTVCCE